MEQKEQDNKKKKQIRQAIYAGLIAIIIFLLIFGEHDATQVTDDVSATISTQASDDVSTAISTQASVSSSYHFKNEERLQEHYDKHGKEMGYTSPEEYEAAASKVVTNPASLHKYEAEDGDDVYYLQETNEFVIVSRKGYIRTYFYPQDGIDYYERQ